MLGRLLWLSLLVYLIALSSLAMWSGLRTSALSENSRRLVTLSDGWQSARYWVAQEETLERKEVLTPNVFVRRLHARAVAWVDRLVRDLAAQGTPADRAAAATALAANATYDVAMQQMFAAVEHHDNATVTAIHDRIDPTYDVIEHAVVDESNLYHLAAYRSLAEVGRTQAFVVWLTPVVGFVGLLVLLAFFVVLENYRRRADVARRERVQRLERAALVDALTGLGNHRAFQEAFRRFVTARRHGDRPLKLAIVDVDDFKLVNDRRGHRQGDAVLAALGGLLQSQFGALAYRTGGDEFTVLVPDADPQEAFARLEAVRTAAVAALDGATVSIGLAELGPAMTDPEMLVEAADNALYEAKHRGRNTVAVTAPDAAVGASTRSSSKRAALATLIASSATSAVQQPIWDLSTATILGYEALTRLDASVALTGPAEAFAVAESLGRAHELDAACLRAIGTHAEIAPGELLFVNLSPQSLRDTDAARGGLIPLLEALPVAHNALVLELTERTIATGLQTRERLEQFASRHIRFALDDTASANAGLEVLGSLPIHFVKVDGSVLRRSLLEARMAAVLVGILATARELGAWAILEGIESDEALYFAAALVARTDMWGRVAVQGFHLGMPQLGRLTPQHAAVFAARIAAAGRHGRGALTVA